MWGEEQGCACAAVDHSQRRTSAHPFAFVDRCRRQRSARPCAAVDRCLGTPSAAAIDGRGEACLISAAVEETKERLRLVKGVGKEVKRLSDNFQAIQAVLIDAEQRQVKEAQVRRWLEKLKDASYDMEDVLDEWNTSRLKLLIEGVDDDDENADRVFQKKKKTVCSFFPAASCFGFKQIFLHRDIALKIKAIDKRLDDIAKQKDMFNLNVVRNPEKSERMQTTSLINVSEVRGRDEEMNILKSKLLCEFGEEQHAIQIISMVGMGGIGKTTLAQFVYNDSCVINNFDKRMWVCVSDNFDEFRIAKAIIEALEGSAPNLGELQSLLQHIYASIVGKRFFLVLDDVWTDDYSKWEPFHNCLMHGLRGSKILVTTRNEKVVRMMESTDVISIKELSEQECWWLFKRFAFFGRPPSECEQLVEIGQKIVGNCKGLPLAAKTIGSLLRFKRTREEWESVLNSEMWWFEELEKYLFAPLLLSYNDLPSMIKQCFLYCTVFPKDYNIEKDELIKLWMAQGYIEQKGNKEMEIIGQEYFDCLATRSFFQDFVHDDEGTVIGCKMHDIVHDFARYLTKNEYLSIEVDGSEVSQSLINTCQEELRHSILFLGYNASLPVCIYNAKKLRSLLIYSSLYDLSAVLRYFFDQLTCLRALRVSGYYYLSSICEIPKRIETLIHLRYLKLAWLETEELPETCCELCNLQTIEIEECSNLRRLPQRIGKLVNLRHLIFVDVYLDYMPKGIERLTCLRTLSEFVVSGRGKYGNKACNLEGMRDLNNLRGSLIIRGLGNVTSIDEAKTTNLDKKKNLVHLELRFNKEKDDGAGEAMNLENEVNHEAISEALQAPPNIESLEMCYYKGKTALPSWVVLLNKLKKLYLTHCNNCEIMPSLGKLPSLEILQIIGMRSVKRVGDEFWGIENHHSSSSSSSIVAFPKLKKLTLRGLYEWEEWEIEKEDIAVMPQLISLELGSCSKLKSLPVDLLRSQKLKMLEIYNCPILKERFKKDVGEDWAKIFHIPNIQINGHNVQGGSL
ncbi:hypothetical protein KPL70_025596 [Citrus sinensis]|nr:hypothetical protein KPL70_025596 [Citrus sinensis]